MSRGPLLVSRVESWPVKRRRTSSAGSWASIALPLPERYAGRRMPTLKARPSGRALLRTRDVERLVAREHREQHRFLGRDAAVAPERVELLGDVGAGDEGLGQAHDARADQERAVGLAAQVAERDQRGAQAVDAALRQRQLARQPRQRHRLAAARQPIEQRQRARHRRHQRRDGRALARERQGVVGSEGHGRAGSPGDGRRSGREARSFIRLNRFQRTGRGV